MIRNRTSTAPISVQNRTKVGNGTRVLADIDYRSVLGRRFRELIEDYEREFEVVSKVDKDLIRLAAALVMKSEEMTAATVRGEDVDADAVIKMAGQLRRVLADLKRRSHSTTTPASASILEHFQDTQDEEAEA